MKDPLVEVLKTATPDQARLVSPWWLVSEGDVGDVAVGPSLARVT